MFLKYNTINLKYLSSAVPEVLTKALLKH